MIPVFIEVTTFFRGDKRLINMCFVQQIMETTEGNGSVLVFQDGQKISIKEKPAQMEAELNRQAAEIRYECWKKLAADKELL